MQPQQPESPLVHFNVFVNSGRLTNENVDHFLRAITATWEADVGEPISFDLIITDRVERAGGEENTHPTSYMPGHNFFLFACDQIAAWAKEHEMDFDSVVPLVAGHEAKHAVQDHFGLLPRTREEGELYERSYRGHQMEREAWDSSMHVVKAIYPDAEGDFDAGHGATHLIPETSRFADAWTRITFSFTVLDRPPLSFGLLSDAETPETRGQTEG